MKNRAKWLVTTLAVLFACAMIPATVFAASDSTDLAGDTAVVEAVEDEASTKTKDEVSVEVEAVIPETQEEVLVGDGSGWKQVGSDWYYYDSNGNMYTDSVYLIGEDKYYFDANGKMLTGWIYDEDDKCWLYAQANGSLANGLQKVNGRWYFFNFCKMYAKTGWHTINGQKYYFTEGGAIQTGWVKLEEKNGITIWGYVDDATAALVTGWKQVNGLWYYFSSSDNHMYYNDWVNIYDANSNYTGAYYFSKSGAMQTGWIYDTDYEEWYYADPSSGRLATGWKQINGSWYYFNFKKDNLNNAENYSMLCPEDAEDGFQEINEEWYYFNTSGAMQTGWIYAKYDNDDDGKIDWDAWYYADSNGHFLAGWQIIGGKWYYFAESEDGNDFGRYPMLTNGVYTLLDGKAYYFDRNGVMQTGWIYDSYYDVWYYADENGHLASGWQWMNGSWYYFDEFDYFMCCDDIYTLDDSYGYYFDKNGVMQTGWIYSNYYESWFYADANGHLATGAQNINGVFYFFDEHYGMCTGVVDIAGSKWLYGSDGKWISGSGLKSVTSSNYEYDETTGKKINYSDTKYYYLNANGSVATGWKPVGSDWYYFSPYDGAAYIGREYVQDQSGSKYYWFLFEENGKLVQQSGWYKLSQGTDYDWYYLDENGHLARPDGVSGNGWIDLNGKRYYAKGSGSYLLQDVAERIDGTYSYYLFDSEAALVTTTGWHSLTWVDGEYSNTEWYYVKNGVCLTGWQKIDGNWYYFSGADIIGGQMHSDCVELLDWNGEKSPYIFSASGALASTKGWFAINEYICYSGEKETYWYYGKGDGTCLTGWQQINGNWYYFNNDGTMACNTYIDDFSNENAHYYIDKNGLWNGVTYYY